MKVILDCDNTMGVRKSDVDDGLTFAYLYAHPDVEVQVHLPIITNMWFTIIHYR